MATPSYARSLSSCVKRLRLSSTPVTPVLAQARHVQSSTSLRATISDATSPASESHALIPSETSEPSSLRLPKAVQAIYLAPLRHQAKFGIETCNLQLRSYSVRNVEIFEDFALRAAYYLKLAARTKPLPRITERWTVPRGNFVHKKSQENFERITVRREIKIMDGHPAVVDVWLKYLRKHQYYGVGMKANVFEFSSLKVGEQMDADVAEVKTPLAEALSRLGMSKGTVDQGKPEQVEEILHREPFKNSWGAYAALGSSRRKRYRSVRALGR